MLIYVNKEFQLVKYRFSKYACNILSVSEWVTWSGCFFSPRTALFICGIYYANLQHRSRKIQHLHLQKHTINIL